MSARTTPVPLRVPLQPRSPDEEHRAATPLELFFDLVFVVAIAQAASSYHHAIADNHIADGLLSYGFVFFAIWWAWVHFTWFASAYDTDDVAYRLVTFVQLAGALVVAAGISSAFEDSRWGIVIVGYVVIRLSSVFQWLRVARHDPDRRTTALRYVIGITAVQMLWCGLYFLPDQLLAPGFLLFVMIELAVPAIAEHGAPTAWHAGHITERHGLFTIIVLGESILAATLAIEGTSITANFDADIAGIIVGGLLIVFSMWWIYFGRNAEDLIKNYRSAFIWGYGHYFIFGAAAAVGAGIAISVDQATGHAEIGSIGAGLAVSIPVITYLIGVWFLQFRFWAIGNSERILAPLFAVAIFVASWSGAAVLTTGLLLALFVAIEVGIHSRSEGFQLSSST